MAVVVEQTLPFSSLALDLQNPQRWNTLLPLIRPTFHPVDSAGSQILVDQAVVTRKSVHVIVVGSPGKLSGKVLDDRVVSAVVTRQHSGSGPTAQDLQNALVSAGAAKQQGVLVVRAGKNRRMEVHGEGLVEVELQDELELNHILHLFGNATQPCQTNLRQFTELLKLFLDGASTAHSTFHVEKADGIPAVMHAEGAAGYKHARDAVERDLKHAMKGHSAQDGTTTFSVHYCDVNGLSRLENYIMAGEISRYFDAQNVQYRLSHSTVLDYSKAARGFSVSVCPVPSQYLTAQSKPQVDKHSSAHDGASIRKVLAPSSSKMAFNDVEIRQRIQTGCNAVIKAEPIITEYDTIVGDGDCGYTLRDGAKQVLSFIEGKDLTQLPETVAQLVSELEVNMGGTSGALYCIYLTALAGALATESSIAMALKAALEQLMKYTRARLGDRTMMDALIPFIDTLAATSDAQQALQRSMEGVEGTKKMEAKLGRSSYLDESATQGVPDPGAYGLLVLFRGMVNGQ